MTHMNDHDTGAKDQAAWDALHPPDIRQLPDHLRDKLRHRASLTARAEMMGEAKRHGPVDPRKPQTRKDQQR